jgi:hypothetical protein
VTRLKTKAATCEFGDQEDEFIRDQVIDKCKSNRMRKKFLEKGSALTLDDMREMARAMEEAERQTSEIDGKTERGKSEQAAGVSRIVHKSRRGGVAYSRGRGDSSTFGSRGNNKDQHTQPRARGDLKSTKNLSSKTERSDTGRSTALECYRCVFWDHKGTDPGCPARNKTCTKCQKEGHFARKCHTKQRTGHQNAQSEKGGRVHQMNERDSDEGESPYRYAFQVVNTASQGGSNMDDRICIYIGGCTTEFLIDSGCTSNIVTEETWNDLKARKIKCTTEKDTNNKRLYPYGSHRPLQIMGTFKCGVTVKGHSTSQEEEFTVVKEKGCNLLGKDTGIRLGILKLGINQMTSGNIDWESEFPTVFNGLGKLKDYQLEIAIDDKVEPIAQKARRVPFGLREKLEEKINELEEMGVVEKVEGPTPWVSPVVIVPKSNGEIRLCVDMQQANAAVIRE